MRINLLLAKIEAVLLGMIDRLTAIGKCYGIEMNLEKINVMRTSRQPSPIQIMVDRKATAECGIFTI
jgi:hypothetical protein